VLVYKLSFILTIVGSPIIGYFVLSKGKQNRFNKYWAVFQLFICLWAIGRFGMLIADNKATAFFWCRFLYLASIALYVLFFHTIMIFLKREHARRIFIIFFYFCGGFLEVINLLDMISGSSFFIKDVTPKLNFHYYEVPGNFYWLQLFLNSIIPTLTCYEIYRSLLHAVGKNRNQLKYLLIASIVGFLGGSTVLPLIYGFNIHPIGLPIIPLYFLALTYGIFKYQLMDIEVIIRKTLVFAGLFSFAFGVFAFVTFLTQEVLSAYVPGTAGKLLSLFISVFLIVLGYDPLRRFLINLTDQFLFQKKYDYRKLLRDASAGISQIKSLNQLLSLVTHFVTMRIRVKSGAILMHDEKNQYFRFAYSRGYPKDGWLHQGHIFNANDSLINYLKEERAPLDIERIKEYAETGGPKSRRRGFQPRYDFKAIQARMEELQAACCVPSFLGENLRNILILGEKKSGDFFTDDDLHVLFTLAQESAIAIENARLYDQAIEKAKELEGINEQLNTAQSNLLGALNETEVANKKLRDTHAQLIHEQKMATLGRLASSVGHEVNNPLTILSMNVSRAILKHRSNPDLKVREVLDIFQKMEQNISRIKAVVNTLTGLLKKSEHGKFEPLSLKLVLEETLPLVQFQTYLENLSGTEVTFDIPSNTPLIKGDLERLQEVFLNLFINAYHAMAGRRDRKILVTAHESPAHPAMVLLEFSDNGSGMTDEVMKKAFSYGFTTKPTGKGSGMGLYMCRYIIELHGGEIKARSKAGEGTTFVITLPIYYEPTSVGSGESAEQ